MKKWIVIITVVVCIAIMSLSFLGISTIQNVYQNEIATVQTMTGAILFEYPEIENTLVEALIKESTEENRKLGAKILARYGYDEKNEMHENLHYQKFWLRYVKIVVVFALIFGGIGYSLFFSMYRKQKMQEESILSILSYCLEGSEKYLEIKEEIANLDHPIFSDAIMKLVNNLQLKSERLNEERDDTKTLVTDISHQLKTPIAALKTCFSIYTETREEEKKVEFEQRCRLQMDKLESLTAALIQISRLETQMITLNLEPVWLSEIFIGAVNGIYHKALKKNIEIEMADFEDIEVHVDRKWTVESIVNLLDNAVKYSPIGSKILIRVCLLYSFVRIEIEDSGIGIPKKEQNLIFHRFYRGEDLRVKKEDGSGVGLYLARKILEDEGGTLSVRPREGEGSIFVVQLPL